MTAPTVTALLKAFKKSQDEAERLRHRVEVLEGMTSAAGDHGNASHTPDFQPAGGYSKGQLLAADVTGLLNALAISTDGYGLVLDSTQTYGVKWRTGIHLGAAATPTILAGDISVADGKAVIAVSPESGTADDLDTISGGAAGDLIFLFNGAAANDITLRHNIGATANRMLLLTARNFVLDSGQDGVWLLKASAASPWIQVSHPLLTGTVTPADVAAAAAVGTNNRLADALHVHAHPPSQHASGGALALYSTRPHENVPDAAFDAVITAGDMQGKVLHSDPSGETAYSLEVDSETAPGASGLPVTWKYGDTNDLDTAASWTTIATITLSSEKSLRTTSMTNAAIPASRLVQMNIGTIVGSPKNAGSSLWVKVPLTT